jgi:hypothetical protein
MPEGEPVRIFPADNVPWCAAKPIPGKMFAFEGQQVRQPVKIRQLTNHWNSVTP